MIWKKKCAVCRHKYNKSEPFHELRLKTGDGVQTIEICSECADFLDKSADVLSRGKNRESV
jgi:hypothetical protein